MAGLKQWLESVQLEWLEARLQEEPVQKALRSAQEVVRLEARHRELTGKLAALESTLLPVLAGFPGDYDERIKALRGKVEALTTEFQQHVRRMTSTLQPLPRRPLLGNLVRWVRGDRVPVSRN